MASTRRETQSSAKAKANLPLWQLQALVAWKNLQSLVVYPLAIKRNSGQMYIIRGWSTQFPISRPSNRSCVGSDGIVSTWRLTKPKILMTSLANLRSFDIFWPNKIQQVQQVEGVHYKVAQKPWSILSFFVSDKTPQPPEEWTHPPQLKQINSDDRILEMLVHRSLLRMGFTDLHNLFSICSTCVQKRWCHLKKSQRGQHKKGDQKD